MGFKPKELHLQNQQSVQQESTAKRATGVPCGELHLQNQLNEEFDLMSGSKYGFDKNTIFYPYSLKVFKLKKVRYLKLLLVVNIQTYVYGPSRALGKKH